MSRPSSTPPPPPDLFSHLPPYVAVEVTHREALGGAWGQHVIVTLPRTENEGDPRASAPAKRATFLPHNVGQPAGS